MIDEPEIINGLIELENNALPAAKHSDEKGSFDEIQKVRSISIHEVIFVL